MASVGFGALGWGRAQPALNLTKLGFARARRVRAAAAAAAVTAHKATTVADGLPFSIASASWSAQRTRGEARVLPRVVPGRQHHSAAEGERAHAARWAAVTAMIAPTLAALKGGKDTGQRWQAQRMGDRVRRLRRSAHPGLGNTRYRTQNRLTTLHKQYT